jgi:hypothetical protein
MLGFRSGHWSVLTKRLTRTVEAVTHSTTTEWYVHSQLASLSTAYVSDRQIEHHIKPRCTSPCPVCSVFVGRWDDCLHHYRISATIHSHSHFPHPICWVRPSIYSIRPLPSCKICRLLPSLNIQHIHPCAKTIKPQFTGYAFKIQTIQAGTTVVRSFRCQLLLHAALTSALLCGASLCILLSTLNIYLVCPQALMHACMHVTLRPPCR